MGTKTINPLWLTKKTSFVTAKMPATYHRDFIDQVRVLSAFLEFNILICILMGRQRRTHLNPAPSAAIQPPAQPQTQRAQEKKEATKPLGHALDPQRQENGCYSKLWPTSKTSQGTRILSGCNMSFYLIKERIHHSIKMSVTNFKKQLKVGLKLAITLTPGHWRDLHVPAVILVGWSHHYLQICSPSLPSHPC